MSISSVKYLLKISQYFDYFNILIAPAPELILGLIPGLMHRGEGVAGTDSEPTRISDSTAYCGGSRTRFAQTRSPFSAISPAITNALR